MEMEAKVFLSMAEIPRASWETLTENVTTPILDWNWLELLESSESITEANGWRAHHLTLWDKGTLVAGAPLYLRSHSWGDFVFDFGFADAATKLKFSWYPKLVGMSPATPSVGYEVLTAPGYDKKELTLAWLEEAERLASSLGAVSLQFNFTDPAWFELWRNEAKDAGKWYAWVHQNYLFENNDLADFGGYLARFDKNQRRNIIRERKKFHDQGLRIEIAEGDEIPANWFPLMAELYERTNDRFGMYAAKFLEPKFFADLEKIRNLLAFSASIPVGSGEPIALGMMIRKKSLLIGRYWGEGEWRNSQYFNVCYYGPIEWAIRNGIRAFDPGAGSYLKTRRGFASKTNLSLHRFFDERAGKLFAAFISDINREEKAEIDALNEAIPLKSTLANLKPR
jgi:uncharacterized protein